MSVETMMIWDTGYSADSVEWCPISPYTHIFVCGTYQLDTSKSDSSLPPNRIGKICLFQISTETVHLDPIQTIETAAILDQKWCPKLLVGSVLLGCVDANGCLKVYKLQEEKEELVKLVLLDERGINAEKGTLALSLDWSTLGSSQHIVVSDSAGQVHLIELQQSEKLRTIACYKGHGFECWITAFNAWNCNIFYTGGDDSLLRAWDARVPNTPVSTCRVHEAGVTSLHSSSNLEYHLLSGSYDEKVRVWDSRKLSSPRSEAKTGGGVWRVRWNPWEPRVVLAACMLGGFTFLDVGWDTAQIVAQYDAHNSLAYGADWCRQDGILGTNVERKKYAVVTCSFYDCKLHLSIADLSK